MSDKQLKCDKEQYNSVYNTINRLKDPSCTFCTIKTYQKILPNFELFQFEFNQFFVLS